MTLLERLKQAEVSARPSSVVVMAGSKRARNGPTWVSLDLADGVYDEGGFQVARFATRGEAEQYALLRNHAAEIIRLVEAAQSRWEARQAWILSETYGDEEAGARQYWDTCNVLDSALAPFLFEEDAR